MKQSTSVLFVLITLFLLSACSPKLGTEAWCKDMKDKAKGEWTASDAGVFAKHCILGNFKGS